MEKEDWKYNSSILIIALAAVGIFSIIIGVIRVSVITDSYGKIIFYDYYGRFTWIFIGILSIISAYLKKIKPESQISLLCLIIALILSISIKIYDYQFLRGSNLLNDVLFNPFDLCIIVAFIFIILIHMISNPLLHSKISN